MSNILSALKAIDPSEVSYQEWINVGMALQNEGYDCIVWDEWSRNDRRYHPGECERKWRTFHGAAVPITGATVVQMAKDRGWTPYGEDGVLDWNDSIMEDGDGYTPYAAPDTWHPVDELITYLETLFEPDDYVGYVTGDVWQDSEGRWFPSKGVFDRTAGELIAALKKHPDDIGAAVGDWKPDVGAWIRFNPVDGEGVKNDNIVKFKYALVESDTMPIADQDAMYRKLELPIACLVHSGGKSLHAIVRVDAEDYDEYRKRVEFLYDFLDKNGVHVDKGMPVTEEQKKLTDIAEELYGIYPFDGKYILDGDDLIVCQSNVPTKALRKMYPGAAVNPLGDWTGGTNVDTGATNRKLGSDMADGVTGGGLHGKDLSKADVSVNIYAFLKAQELGQPVELFCGIGDTSVDGKPYGEIVEIARSYIKKIGGFEKFAEWGLVR